MVLGNNTCICSWRPQESSQSTLLCLQGWSQHLLWTTPKISANQLRVNKPKKHFSCYLTGPLTAERTQETHSSLRAHSLSPSPSGLLLVSIREFFTWHYYCLHRDGPQTLPSHSDLSQTSGPDVPLPWTPPLGNLTNTSNSGPPKQGPARLNPCTTELPQPR